MDAFQSNAFQSLAFQFTPATRKKGGQTSKFIKRRRDDEQVILAVIHAYMQANK